jgi:hypothetical protein
MTKQLKNRTPQATCNREVMGGFFIVTGVLLGALLFGKEVCIVKDKENIESYEERAEKAREKADMCRNKLIVLSKMFESFIKNDSGTDFMVWGGLAGFCKDMAEDLFLAHQILIDRSDDLP